MKGKLKKPSSNSVRKTKSFLVYTPLLIKVCAVFLEAFYFIHRMHFIFYAYEIKALERCVWTKIMALNITFVK